MYANKYSGNLKWKYNQCHSTRIRTYIGFMLCTVTLNDSKIPTTLILPTFHWEWNKKKSMNRIVWFGSIPKFIIYQVSKTMGSEQRILLKSIDRQSVTDCIKWICFFLLNGMNLQQRKIAKWLSVWLTKLKKKKRIAIERIQLSWESVDFKSRLLSILYSNSVIGWTLNECTSTLLFYPTYNVWNAKESTIKWLTLWSITLIRIPHVQILWIALGLIRSWS